METKHSAYNFEFDDVVLFLFRNWKRLLIVSLAAPVLTFLVTGPWFITPKYKSDIVFYPGTTNSISSALFYTVRTKAQDPLMFADQEITEHYLQLLESNDLSGRVINRYGLYQHYGLDPASLKDQKKMGKIYKENFAFSRTDFNSIKVEVMDPSAEKAAELARGVVDVLDEMKHEVQRNVAKQIFSIVEKEYVAKLNYCDSLKTRLRQLGAEGVYDYSNQSKGLAEVVGQGKTNSYTERERDKLGQHGGESFMLITLLELESENLALLRTKYEQAQVDLRGELSNVFIISNAYIAQEKAYPRRLLLMIVAGAAGFVMGCVTIIGYDRFSDLRNKLEA